MIAGGGFLLLLIAYGAFYAENEIARLLCIAFLALIYAAIIYEVAFGDGGDAEGYFALSIVTVIILTLAVSKMKPAQRKNE